MALAAAGQRDFRNYIKYNDDIPNHSFADLDAAKEYLLSGLKTARELVTEGGISVERIVVEFTDTVDDVHMNITDGVGELLKMAEYCRILVEIGRQARIYKFDLVVKENCARGKRKLLIFLATFLAIGIPLLIKLFDAAKTISHNENEMYSSKVVKRVSLDGMIALFGMFMPYCFPIIWKAAYDNGKKEARRRKILLTRLSEIERATWIITKVISINVCPFLPIPPLQIADII